MPHSHKKKTLAVKRCLAVGLLAIAAAIGVLFGPSALVLAQGPTRIDPLADNDVGVELPKSKLADADAVVADTQRMVNDADGSYRWDGSQVTVRGTLQPMDAETEAQFRAYLRDAGFGDDEIGPDDTCTFRPLVLTDGKINGHRTALLIFASAAALLALFGAVGMTLAAQKK